ncbi:hypothetical protein D3C80_677120 [compost metagenome]
MKHKKFTIILTPYLDDQEEGNHLDIDVESDNPIDLLAVRDVLSEALSLIDKNNDMEADNKIGEELDMIFNINIINRGNY